MNASSLWMEKSASLPMLFSPAYGFRRIWLVALLLVSILFSGCETDHVKPGKDQPGFCGTMPMPGESCNTYVTVRNAVCANGIWGNRWFQLDNGDFLQPWDASVTVPKEVEDGQRFRINYEFTTRDNRHPEAACLAVPPPAKAIRITCIDPLPPTGCTVSALAVNATCGMGYWGSIWLQLADGTYLQPWEVINTNFRIETGKRYKIGYEKMTRDGRYDGTVTCMALPPNADAVRITCLEEEGSSN